MCLTGRPAHLRTCKLSAPKALAGSGQSQILRLGADRSAGRPGLWFGEPIELPAGRLGPTGAPARAAASLGANIEWHRPVAATSGPQGQGQLAGRGLACACPAGARAQPGAGDDPSSGPY